VELIPRLSPRHPPAGAHPCTVARNGKAYPMMAILGFIAFTVAAILELVKTHLDAVIWLIIIGGALVCADVAWGWYGRRGVRRVVP
jgi:hypothetical protein